MIFDSKQIFQPYRKDFSPIYVGCAKSIAIFLIETDPGTYILCMEDQALGIIITNKERNPFIYKFSKIKLKKPTPIL